MVETNAPKITIVTVTFNAEDFVEKTIRSVSEQTHSNYEYLLIDGGSTDGTMEIARRNEASFTKIVSEPDDGIYSAMNKGVRLGRGEWIYFLNAGDELHEATTLEQISEALTADVDFLYGDRCRLSKDGGLSRENAGMIENTYLKEVIFHQALLTRATLLKERPYSECYRIAADYEYVVHSYKAGKRFKYIPVVIANFLEGGVSNRNPFVTKIEAAKASLDHIPKDLSIKKNYYLENLVVGNAGYYLSQYLHKSKSQNQGLRIQSERVGMSSRLYAEGGTAELDRFLASLNRELTDRNIVDEEYIVRDVENRPKSGELDSSGDLLVGGGDSTPCAIRNQNPRISIVTVSFNSEDQIERTIESVLDQNYSDIEYIVVHDESNEGTSAILEEYRDKICKILGILGEKEDSIYNAMNKGIDLASGDYILFMNAGDRFCDRNVVSRIFSGQGNLADLIYGDRIYVKVDGEQIYQEANNFDTAYVRIPYCHQSLFLRTDIIRKYRFNTEYKCSADYEQALRLLQAGCTHKKIETPVCMRFQGKEGESRMRLYVEATKILFDNCSDKKIIRKNHYFSNIRDCSTELFDI